MEPSIIFVDDEINVLNGLRRSLYASQFKWKASFIQSGVEALNVLKSERCDIIISDIKMPGIDGSELLRIVKKNYPQVVRFALSGFHKEDLAIQSSNIFHQYFAKPFEWNLLREKIEPVMILKELIVNNRTIELINSGDVVPALPEIYYKLERELNSEDISIHRIVNIISKDIALTAKILHLANSAYFGTVAQITNLHQAVTMLGINIIKSLVLYINIFNFVNKNPRIKDYIEELWSHSILVASLSKQIMEFFTKDRVKSERAYIAGILHDIGKIIQLSLLLRIGKENLYPMEESESKDLLGATHSELGAYLLSLWGLPKEIVEGVLLHHTAPVIESNNISIHSAVQLANSLADLKYEDPYVIDAMNSNELVWELIESIKNGRDADMNMSNTGGL
ncbi:HDOD domain-containing protein [Melioribacter sp. OK-6-Me]|uniref:HDOD domain-containing protein n=1 Tax=unclassified Melioribacter TaxID=2627329 RepID=UPI003ED90D82